MYGRAQAPGCGLRHGKGAGNSGGHVRALRPGGPARSPPRTLPRPGQLSSPKGNAGAGEQPPTARYGPASWRAGPRAPAPRLGLLAAAWRSGRAQLPGLGSCLGTRLGPALLRGVRSAWEAAVLEPGPRPAPPSQQIARPRRPRLGHSSFRLPCSRGKETPGWGWGPPDRCLITRSRAGPGTTWAVGAPLGSRGPRPGSQGPQAGRTISRFRIDVFPLPWPEGCTKANLVLSPACGLSLLVPQTYDVFAPRLWPHPPPPPPPLNFRLLATVPEASSGQRGGGKREGSGG